MKKVNKLDGCVPRPINKKPIGEDRDLVKAFSR